MRTPRESFSVPREPITSAGATVSGTWDWFFRAIFERLYSLGQEQSFEIKNGQTPTPAAIDGLRFDARGVAQATVDYLIHRARESGVEACETGTLYLLWYPESKQWALHKSDITQGAKVNSSGVTFSITTDGTVGQVNYTSSVLSGSNKIIFSRMFWRARTLAGKSKLFSSIGAR